MVCQACLKRNVLSFSSPEPKAYGLANSVPVTPTSVVCPSIRLSACPSTFSNNSSETTGPIKVKFHMETPKHAGTKVRSNGSGHMTKMAATPIYGKYPLKIFLSKTRRLMTFGLGMLHCGCKAYQVCSNHDRRLTLAYLTSMSYLLTNAFKGKLFLKR